MNMFEQYDCNHIYAYACAQDDYLLGVVCSKAHPEGEMVSLGLRLSDASETSNPSSSKGDCLKMARKTKESVPSFATVVDDESGNGGASMKLHLVLDFDSHARLCWLKGSLRAASFGEVIRRSLYAYEIFDPEMRVRETINSQMDNHFSSEGAKPKGEKHVYVELSKELKDCLDQEKYEHGRTYRETISRALCVLTQLVRERSIILKKVKGEKNDTDVTEQESDSLRKNILMAL